MSKCIQVIIINAMSQLRGNIAVGIKEKNVLIFFHADAENDRKKK